MHVDYSYQYLISILLSLQTFFEKIFASCSARKSWLDSHINILLPCGKLPFDDIKH